MNLIDVNKQFATDEQCLDYLVASRWPAGVRCVTCGTDKVSVVTRKAQSKNKRNRFFVCLESTCKQQFSATTGTIFHDSHLPLQKWFLALSLVLNAKKGMSAKQLQRDLGIKSYRTAWYLNHRIRKAMQGDGFKLSGDVECDETYISGKAKIRGRKRSTRANDTVFGMIERGGEVRFFHVPDGKKTTIQPLLDRHISSGARRIITDEATVYPFALDKQWLRKHRTVNHSKEYVVPGTDIHTNTIESAFSLLKRGLIGSFHFVSIKHLHRYLSEFEYRFNGRKDPELFKRTLQRMMATIPMEYKQLTSETV